MSKMKTSLFPIFVLVAAMALAAGCRSRGRSPGMESCIPGTQLLVACAGGCGVGSCTGDPVLRVCDGATSVSACESGVGMLGENDDARVCSSGLCSALEVTCPASGAITVTHRAFGSGASSYACSWEVQAIGAGGGAEPEGDAGR